MEYTKGKWEVENMGECSLIMVDDRTCVARTFKTYYPTEAQEANAHLIAASPRLFEWIKGRADEGDNDAKLFLTVLGLDQIEEG